MALLLSYLLFVSSVTTSATAVYAETGPKVPVAVQINKIVIKAYPTIAKAMNDLIKNGASDNDLKRFKSEEDKKLFKAVFEGLKIQKAKFIAQEQFIKFYSSDGTATLKVVDYINQKFSVNGVTFRYDMTTSFKDNLLRIDKLLTPKTVLDYIPFVDSAYAVLPLLGIGLIVSGVGAAVTGYSDTVVSAGLNDTANGLNREITERINELERQYEQRANTCEADLAQARTQSGSGLTGNNTIRMVGALIEGLGAELNHHWLDMNDKKEIDYSQYGCEMYDGQDGIRNRRLLGVWNVRPHGDLLRGLCDHQDRLNACFKATEEVMRENDVRVNDLAGPDRIGPYDGLIEDYVELGGASSR